MTEYIQGIDISGAQGPNVNHAEVAASGMNFCICKATEGVGYLVDTFKDNIARIRETHNMGRIYYPGAYHFARPDSVGGAIDGKAEGEWFCDVIEEACGSIIHNFMPPALDFEKYSESDGGENIPWIEAWIEVVQRRLQRDPMIYTGRNVWRYEVSNTSRFVQYPLWQVYYSGTAESPPDMPWESWTFWQYSGGGNFQHHPPVPGVGVVDVNRFRGDINDLHRIASGGTLPAVGYPKPPEQLDLATLAGSFSPYVARVQGLLLGLGYGPDGLVGKNGLPDGLWGPKTAEAMSTFKRRSGLPDTTVADWDTWWALSYKGLV